MRDEAKYVNAACLGIWASRVREDDAEQRTCPQTQCLNIRKELTSGGGKLVDYTLLHLEETVKAMLNRAIRDELITHNHAHCFSKQERLQAKIHVALSSFMHS